MIPYLTPLLQLQRFFIPGLLILLAWAIWRTVVRRDLAVGLALYLGLVIVVDGFLNTGIYLPGLAFGSIRYSEICALFLLINQPVELPTQSRRRLIGWLVSLYFGLMFLAALRSDSMMAGVVEYRRLIVPQIVAFLVAFRGLGSLEQYHRFFACLTALVLFVGLFVFWDVFFDITILKSELLFKPEYWNNRKQGRFGGLFLNPNFLGAFVVLIFPAAYIWMLNSRWFLPRLYAWAGLLALVFCLIETKSRAPMLAFAMVFLMLLVGPAGTISRLRRAGFLVLFVLVFAAFMPGFYKHATERFDRVEEETTTEAVSRQTLWVYTKEIIADHPLAGIGFGESQYITYMHDYGFAEKYGRTLDNPHNSYLQAAVYAGIPALVIFLLANLVLLFGAARCCLRGDSEKSVPVVFGVAIGITGFLLCIYPDMHLFTSNVAPVYWVFYGLLLAFIPEVVRAKYVLTPKYAAENRIE